MTVPEEYHLPASDIASGFSISAWIQPHPQCDGFIMAKVAEGDQEKTYYSLKVKITGERSAYLECRYSTRRFVSGLF